MKTLLEFLVNKPITQLTNNIIKYVDLGLPSGLLWADRNLGAKTPEEIGDYYKWGEVKPIEKNRSVKDHKFFVNGEWIEYTEANRNLKACDDIATIKDKNSFIPTLDNIEELITYTDIEIYNDTNIKLSSQRENNNNYIIFPLAGFLRGNDTIDKNHSMGIWACTNKNKSTAYSLMADIDFKIKHYTNDCLKWFGLQIRSVKRK